MLPRWLRILLTVVAIAIIVFGGCLASVVGMIYCGVEEGTGFVCTAGGFALWVLGVSVLLAVIVALARVGFRR